MSFFNSAVDVFRALVIALGAGATAFGVRSTFLEGHGDDNPGANGQGI